MISTTEEIAQVGPRGFGLAWPRTRPSGCQRSLTTDSTVSGAAQTAGATAL